MKIHPILVTGVWHGFHFLLVYNKNCVIIIVLCPVDYAGLYYEFDIIYLSIYPTDRFYKSRKEIGYSGIFSN